jgi:hypothetical protein
MIKCREEPDVTLRTVGGHKTAETIEDLEAWLRQLDGCPPIGRTVRVRCTRPVHGEDPATWFYVEADAAAGVARMRCLACGDVRPVLDSSDRWTFPSAWSCFNCNQAIAEVVFGLHAKDGVATWLAMSVRCVECGHLQGLTDFVLAGIDVDDLAASL